MKLGALLEGQRPVRIRSQSGSIVGQRIHAEAEGIAQAYKINNTGRPECNSENTETAETAKQSRKVALRAQEEGPKRALKQLAEAPQQCEAGEGALATCEM
jgi:hypothetical protein